MHALLRARRAHRRWSSAPHLGLDEGLNRNQNDVFFENIIYNETLALDERYSDKSRIGTVVLSLSSPETVIEEIGE